MSGLAALFDHIGTDTAIETIECGCKYAIFRLQSDQMDFVYSESGKMGSDIRRTAENRAGVFMDKGIFLALQG